LYFSVHLFYFYFIFTMSSYINSFEIVDYKISQNITILQYLKFNGYDVPRFCFHEKLDIVASIVKFV